MVRPKILISGTAGRMERYMAAVKDSGGDGCALWAPRVDASAYQGLLLCGGGDLSPQLTGHPDNGLSRDIDPEREACDLALIAAFMAKNRPVFGICRGLQMLNAALGGALYQDLGTQNRVHGQKNGLDQFHLVTARQGSWLEQSCGACFFVNSSHHQAVMSPAPGLLVDARAEDGTIEALSHDHLPVFGVQWHPERLYREERTEFSRVGRAQFYHFIRLCRQS